MIQWVLPLMCQALCAALRRSLPAGCLIKARPGSQGPGFGSICLKNRWALPPLQATKFEAEAGAGSQVQHLFNIMSTLLEARMLALKQKCAPAALAVSSSDGSDVEALLDRVSDAIKVICLGSLRCRCAAGTAMPASGGLVGTFVFPNVPHVLCGTPCMR